MTNPNDAVGTNAGYNGRTSSKAFNDGLGAFTKGILSGWQCSPKSGMVVSLGGNGTDRDVAIAEDNAGNRTTINNRLGTAIDVTISTAPITNSRIDVIVAYAEQSIQGSGSSDVDFPSGVGLITVSGTVAANPTAPNDTAIRSAITADGATGSSAFYVVLAEILVGTGVTTIGSGVITQGDRASLSNQIDADDIDFSTLTASDLDTITTTSRLDIGKWHFLLVEFLNSTSGWVSKSLTIPADFGGNIKAIELSAAYGNSGNNYGCTWFNQTTNSVQVRFYQTTAGNNGWQALIVAIF